MALIKCKECGEQISSKAKSCPKCGAATPKKTSMFTWLVLVIFLVFVFNAVTNKGSKSPGSAAATKSTGTKQVSSVAAVPPPKPAWTVHSNKDPMTGELKAYASSPSALVLKRMEFPYADVESWMGMGCSKDSEWAYFGFSTSPNLNDTETEDGYSTVVAKVKWNDSLEDVRLIQTWGDKFLSFMNDDYAIKKIGSSDKVLLQLHWHGQQPAVYEYSLNGSSKALADIRALCGKK